MDRRPPSEAPKSLLPTLALTFVADKTSRAMPGVDFNALRNEVSMEEVLKELRFQPAGRSGDQLHGPCPVHGPTSPGSRTFSVNLANGRYYCHKCHSRGNQLELWAAAHKLSLYDAAVDLCRALAREVPWVRRW